MIHFNKSIQIPAALFCRVSMLLYFLILHFGYIAQAQEMNNFSLFHLAPLQTNPAMLATSNQKQLILNYRSQFISAGQAFATPMFSAMMPILNRGIGKRYGGIGISAINDRVGNNGILQTTGGSLAAAINIDVTPTHHFALGIQGGYFQRAINVNQIQTSDMYVPGLGVVASTTENFENLNKSFPLFNAGFMWYHTGIDADSAETVRAFLGANFQSLNQPDISFVAQNYDKLSLNYIITGGVTLWQNRAIGISPNFRWVRQRAGSKMNVGAILQYNTQDNGGFMKTGSLGLGLWYSNTNAAVIGVQVEQPNYALAFSYDLGANSNLNYLGSAAIEISLGIKIGNRKMTRKTPESPPDEPEKEDKLPKIIVKDTLNTDDATYILQHTKQGKQIIKTDTLQKISIETTDEEPTEQDLEIFKRKATFYYISSDINRSSEILLNEIARVMRKFRKIKIQVDGYACNIGKNEEANKELSIKRAQEVKRFLVSKGIKEDRIATAGYGSQNPLLPNDTEYGRIQNRRAEFKVIYPKQK